MLEKCAPGNIQSETEHHIRITWNGKVFPRLPLGPHGKKDGAAEIQVGHIRKMARALDITDCAKKVLEALR